MATRHRRSHFFIHASSQSKVIALSVIPALLMAVYSLYVVYVGTWPVIVASVETPRVSVMEARALLATYRSPEYAGAMTRGAMLRQLDAQLADMDQQLADGHESMIAAWGAARLRITMALFAALFLVGTLSVLTSHRLVGPLTRIRNNLNSLAAGESIPPVHLRKHDEFKDLAAALEALRQRLDGERGED